MKYRLWAIEIDGKLKTHPFHADVEGQPIDLPIVVANRDSLERIISGKEKVVRVDVSIEIAGDA